MESELPAWMFCMVSRKIQANSILDLDIIIVTMIHYYYCYHYYDIYYYYYYYFNIINVLIRTIQCLIPCFQPLNSTKFSFGKNMKWKCCSSSANQWIMFISLVRLIEGMGPAVYSNNRIYQGGVPVTTSPSITLLEDIVGCNTCISRSMSSTLLCCFPQAKFDVWKDKI